MAKDRAAPFSKKHRRYWLPVLGAMVTIGSINVGLGVCTYTRAGDPEPIHVQPAYDAGLPPGVMPPGKIPADVMRAFATKYPRTIPVSGEMVDGNVVVTLPKNAPSGKQHATFRPDGTFVSED